MKSLTNEERMLVNSEIQTKGKNTLTAYLLLVFLGGLGGHRFYLGKTGTAVGQLVLNFLGWLTILFGVGAFFWFALGIWLIVDLFLIPGFIQKDNDRIEKEIIATF